MSVQNWNANDYAKHSSAQLKWAMELIEKMPLTGTESLLDLGCGDGKITALLAKKLAHGRVLGIDASETMISNAESTFLQAEHPNLSFKKMDASFLTFQEEFDLVFSNSALHWIKDHGPLLKGIRRALKPNGTCFLRFGGKGTLDAFQPCIDAILNNAKWASYFSPIEYFSTFENLWGLYDDASYMDWLVAHELTALSIKLIPSDMVQNNRAALEGWARTTWHPYLSLVPEHLKNEFVSELIDHYLAIHPADDDGKIHVNMIRLEVQAQKG